MTLGAPRRHYARCASTNDLARAWAADAQAPAPHGALVTADFQTRGRGRRGRRWQAAPGQSLLMSLVLRPEMPVAQAWQIGFVAALAVADALAALGASPRIKWPNDVLLGGGKVAGMLVETVAIQAPHPRPLSLGGERGVGPGHEAIGGYAAVVGIGVNVAQGEFLEADSFVYPPTSLRLATGHTPAVEEVLHAVLVALERRVAEREREGFPAIIAGWRERLAVGAAVQRGNARATLDVLQEDGSARVRLPDGTFAEWATVEGEEGADGV